jgi:hypothetical protein
LKIQKNKKLKKKIFFYCKDFLLWEDIQLKGFPQYTCVEAMACEMLSPSVLVVVVAIAVLGTVQFALEIVPALLLLLLLLFTDRCSRFCPGCRCWIDRRHATGASSIVGAMMAVGTILQPILFAEDGGVGTGVVGKDNDDDNAATLLLLLWAPPALL